MKNRRLGFMPIPGFVPLQEICSSKSDCRHVQSAGLVGAVCDQLLIYAIFIMWPSGRLSGCRKYLGIGMKPDLLFFFCFFLRTTRIKLFNLLFCNTIRWSCIHVILFAIWLESPDSRHQKSTVWTSQSYQALSSQPGYRARHKQVTSIRFQN